MVEGESSPLEYLKFALVILAITLISFWLAQSSGEPTVANWLRWFMGVFFVVFASFKLIGYRLFVMMFVGYDIIAQRLKSYANLYPFIELGLGALYLFNLLAPWRDVATLVIMVVGSIGVFQEIRRRRGIHCACLGNVIKLPLSTVSLVEDVGMALMAVLMLIWR